jgi:hypothetical protein
LLCGTATSQQANEASFRSPSSLTSRVLMHFDHIIRCIANANYSVVRSAVEFGVADRIPVRVLFADRRWFSTIGRAAEFKLQHSTTTADQCPVERP